MLKQVAADVVVARLTAMRRMKSFVVLGLLLVSLAGCTNFSSDKPLIIDDQAAFPFAPFTVITISPSGLLPSSAGADANSDSKTLVRKGHFQISAPIQPGNSGGPLLDFGGGIVGIVNAKLNELAYAAETGDFPQNVNFAIKANVLANFLDAYSVEYQTADTPLNGDLGSVGAKAKRFTVMVVCHR